MSSFPDNSSFTSNKPIPPYGTEYQDLPNTSSEEWSSSCSSNISTLDNSDDDSYVPDWEAFVDDDGNLFYLEYNPQNTIQAAQQKPQNTNEKSALLIARNEFKRGSARRSKKATGKLSKLISRHSHKKDKAKKQQKQQQATSLASATMIAGNSNTGTTFSASTKDTTKVKFSELAEGEIKEVNIFIDPAIRHKFGRRTSVCEALCGISICPFPANQRIMVAGFMPNSTICQDKGIKVGDWLKAIDNHDVNIDNIDFILLNYNEPIKIKLTLQRLAVEEQFHEQPNSYKITNISEFTAFCREIFSVSNEYFVGDKWATLNVMYLTLNKTDEHCSDGQDVLFCHPSRERNSLYGIRGTFLTLNSLFRESTFKSTLNSSTVVIQGDECHVASGSWNDEILLIGIHSKYATIEETKFKLTEIIRYMETIAKSVPTFFFYPNLYQNNSHLSDICTIANQINCCRHMKGVSHFEDALPESQLISLPKEAQLRIDDALGEMEAMDYREWNDDPLKSHREFFILGSALFYRKFLLVSHLPASDLQDVEAYIRVSGVSQLLDNQPIRDLVIWHEIYPKSVDRGTANNINIYGYPKRRWHLAIVARNQISLAVILESRHLTTPSTKVLPHHKFEPVYPSPFYIEEIQDTLEHLQSSGLENLINTWINSNKRPQVSMECIRSDGRLSASSGSLLNNFGTKKTEIISILKRRQNSSENVDEIKHYNSSLVGSTSVNSNTFSDESVPFDEEDSDSDWDGFPDSQRSNSGFDVSDLTGTLLKELSDVLPTKISSGRDNVLLHYVQVDIGEGALIAAPNMPSGCIVQSFRNACLLIHNVLQNTIRFRHLLSQENNGKHTPHRTQVAIKEHGVLISASKAMVEPFDFWVIGRLFSSPPKELYVCHRLDVPQNLVELAFRFTLNSAG